MNKSLKLLVTVSLLLNLLLLGVIFGYIGQGVIGSGYVRHISIRELVALLPQEKQKALAPVLAKSEQEIKAVKLRLYEERRKAAELIGAKPFDRKAYLAAIKETMALRTQLINGIANTISDIASQSSDEERARIAHAMTDNQDRQKAAGQ